MRIALCISGFVRDWKKYFPQFQENIIKPLQPDIYFYGYIHKNVDDSDNFIEKFNFKKYRILSFEGVTKKIIKRYTERLKKNNSRPEINIENMLSMFRNIKKCHDLIDNEYDLVIRTRTDLYHNSIPLELLNLARNNIIYEKSFDCKSVSSYAISDHFAIGTPSSMRIYSDIYIILSVNT